MKCQCCGNVADELHGGLCVDCGMFSDEEHAQMIAGGEGDPYDVTPETCKHGVTLAVQS